MNFHGKIIDGIPRFHATDYVKEQCKKHEGRAFVFTIPLPKRSLSQNALYWGVYLPLIAQETGHTTEGLHAHFKKELLPRKYETVMGKEVEIEKSTTDLTKAEFTEYIMQIEAMTGIACPNPEDAGFISNRKPVENDTL